MPRRASKGARSKSSAPKRARLRCVDLFAGAGGFSLSARRARLDVVAAVEFDRHACQTYRRNIVTRGLPKLYEADITELDPYDLVDDCFAQQPCDLVLGGPPCQGFSVHRINDAGKDDPRNKLIHRYFEFVSALNPRAFILENVPGILWPRHATALRRFYEEADLSGYRVMEPITLDARDYGLPQRRKRVFILGLRKDQTPINDWVPEPTHGSLAATRGNPKLKAWISCREVFRLPLGKADPNNIHMQHSADLVKVFRKTPANGGSRQDSGRVLPCHSEHDGHNDVYGRIDPEKSGPTVTTACINPSKGRFLHPTEHHGITLRHAARLQTFPDEYVFDGGLIAGGVQIGNAVPVRLGEVLLARIVELLTCETKQGARAGRAPSMLAAE